MSIIRMINIEATQSERLALRCIDPDGEHDYEVSINGILLHRAYGDK